MKLTNIGSGVNKAINTTHGNNTRGNIIEGVLIQRDESLVLKTNNGELPVRWLGTQAPLSERLLFSIVGHDDNSLILSMVSQNEVDRLEFMLKEWGFDNLFPWRTIIGELVREEMPITREILLSLRQNLRLAQQEWGVAIHPRIIVYLLARNLTITPQTVFWALYRLYPNLRGEFPAQLNRRRTFHLNLANKEDFEDVLFNSEGSDNDSAKSNCVQSALCQNEVWEFPDGGLIHWRRSGGKKIKTNNGFRFELVPPNLGLIEVIGKQDGISYQLNLIVDPHVAGEFINELPRWQAELDQQGYQVTFSVETAQSSTPKLPINIDRRV